MTVRRQIIPSLNLDDEDEKKLVDALIAISTGVHDAAALKIPSDVASNLLACYDAIGED